MTRSSISVIVITFNEEKNIRDCLDSLMALDYPADLYETLVVDASNDATPAIVREYPRVKLIRSEKGFSQQKNMALMSAAFDLLAFTDADCVVPGDWLNVINRAFVEKRIAAIGGNAYPPPGTGRFGKWTTCVGHPAGGAIGFDANVKRSTCGVSFVPGCNSVFRKGVLLDVKGFDPDFFDGGEDVDVSRRLREKGHFLDYVPDLTVYHKPRGTLWSYLKWNVQVGMTKFSIKKPSLLQIILQPSFPLWSVGLFLAILFLGGSLSVVFLLFGGFWLLFVVALCILARPFPLLIKRRKRIGIWLITVLTIIPLLIFLRQICINLGQIKKWLRVRRIKASRSQVNR
jgi:GT2 family glycosyltransferase